MSRYREHGAGPGGHQQPGEESAARGEEAAPG